MQEIIRQFTDAMAEHGLIPHDIDNIIPDDDWHSVRLAQDPLSKRVLYYRLKIEGDFAVGNFGSYREGVTHTWHTKVKSGISREEREAFKAKLEDVKAKKDAERRKAEAEAAKQAKKTWEEAELPIESHPYLSRKGVAVDGLRVDGDKLLIPMHDASGKLWGLQSISPDGDKLFMAGARKKGCFHVLNGDAARIFICEGIATGASIKQAMEDDMVVCAFDAGNIAPVAEAIREAHPNAKIIIAADNDAYTSNGKGEPYNVGVEKAKQAAVRIKGFAIWPEFDNNDQSKYTDFNDLHMSNGIDAVRNQILSKLDPVGLAVGDAPAEVSLVPLGSVGVQTSAGSYIEETQGDLGLPFRVLGHDKGLYFYYPFETQQITALTGGAHSLSNLLQMASLDQWQRQLGGGVANIGVNQIASLAQNAMYRIAHQRGIFSLEDKVRGRGAWMDAGRRILHCGDTIYVDGVPTEPKNVMGKYVYVAAPRLLKPSNNPLSSAEANKLRHICEMPTWETKLSGSLLAGWLVIAPVCSMLPWRPHIWITGEAEAGKSTILDKIVKPVLGSIALIADGGTTEPAIRSMMGYDGRPIICDEAESETQNQRAVMEAVLALARKSSSGQKITKYGQHTTDARFCMCFSAINPGVTAFADESRISMLVLRKNRSPSAQIEYDHLLNEIADTITPDFQMRLLARIVENMPTLLKNIDVFRRAVRTVLNAARIADQLAPMLAGLYLLCSEKIINADAAEKWVAEQDWTMNTAVSSEPDNLRLMRHIATSIIRAGTKRENQADYTVGELISAIARPSDAINTGFADRTLRMYSIAVKDGGVYIGHKNQNLSRLLKGTQWEISWHRTLSSIVGSEQKSGVYFASGDKQRAVLVPIKTFLGDDDDPTSS